MRASSTLVALLGAVLLTCGDPQPAGPVVFAAASLADVLPEIAEEFVARGGERPTFSFAGSGTLARQIEAGAPADLFVTADPALLDASVRAGRVRGEEVVAVASNALVVVTPRDRRLAVGAASDLARASRIAMADPETAPAGAAARDWLQRAGVWDAVRPIVVPTLDVRAALAAVATGNARAGLVYATDARAEPERVTVAWRVPADQAPPIVYVAVPLTGAGEPARAFLRHLASDAARATFRAHGFADPPTQ